MVRGRLTGALAGGLLSGQLEEALLAVNGAISRSTETGAEFDLPELLRIKGKRFLKLSLNMRSVLSSDPP